MGSKRVVVARFPGTNCDRDVFTAAKLAGLEPEFIWYRDRFDTSAYQGVFIPGGFSFGDYLRTGALAARTPLMDSVRHFAKSGGPVLGICNGFQILTESGLLPGVLVRNEKRRFKDAWVDLKLVHENPFFGPKKVPATEALLPDSKSITVRLPIAHGEGRYFTTEDELKLLYDRGQVWLKYGENPNGSVDAIAGVTNLEKNVAGLMPHPERGMADWMGSCDGFSFFLN